MEAKLSFFELLVARLCCRFTCIVSRAWSKEIFHRTLRVDGDVFALPQPPHSIKFQYSTHHCQRFLILFKSLKILKQLRLSLKFQDKNFQSSFEFFLFSHESQIYFIPASNLFQHFFSFANWIFENLKIEKNFPTLFMGEMFLRNSFFIINKTAFKGRHFSIRYWSRRWWNRDWMLCLETEVSTARVEKKNMKWAEK